MHAPGSRSATRDSAVVIMRPWFWLCAAVRPDEPCTLTMPAWQQCSPEMQCKKLSCLVVCLIAMPMAMPMRPRDPESIPHLQVLREWRVAAKRDAHHREAIVALAHYRRRATLAAACAAWGRWAAGRAARRGAYRRRPGCR